MRKLPFAGILFSIVAFMLPACAAAATAYTTSSVQIQSNTSATASSGGADATGGSAAASVHSTTVVNDGGGSVDIEVKTEQDGSENAESIHRDLLPGQGVSIDIATSSADGNASAAIRMNASSGRSAAPAALSGQGASGSPGAPHIQALLDIAGHDEAIAAQVRAVAEEIASTTDEAHEAMQRMQARPAWLTFLFGSDYTSITALRISALETQRQVQLLTAARDQAASSSTRAVLDAQISALEEAASSTQTFAAQSAGKFSLFGWIARLFQ